MQKYAFDSNATTFEENFPLPQAGKSKGLTVILDAHTDQVADSSVYDDVEGFYAIVDSKNQVRISSNPKLRMKQKQLNLFFLGYSLETGRRIGR